MKRFLGMTGMVLAVVGAVISLALLIGGWVGRSAVNDTVAGFVPGIDNLLAREGAQLARASDFLVDVDGSISSARARVQSFTGSNAEDITNFVQNVEGAVETVVEPIQYVRGELATLRSSILMFSSVWNGLPSMFGLPQIPTDRLQAMDDRARQVDQQIAQVQQTVSTTRQNIDETRAAVTSGLDSVQETLARLADDASTYSGVLGNLRANLGAIQSRINTYATVAALSLTVLGLCALALFVNLFYSGWLQWEEGSHRWIKQHSTTTTTDVTTHAIEGGERTVTTVTVAKSTSRQPVEADTEAEAEAKAEAKAERESVDSDQV